MVEIENNIQKHKTKSIFISFTENFAWLKQRKLFRILHIKTVGQFR